MRDRSDPRFDPDASSPGFAPAYLFQEELGARSKPEAIDRHAFAPSCISFERVDAGQLPELFAVLGIAVTNDTIHAVVRASAEHAALDPRALKIHSRDGQSAVLVQEEYFEFTTRPFVRSTSYVVIAVPEITGGPTLEVTLVPQGSGVFDVHARWRVEELFDSEALAAHWKSLDVLFFRVGESKLKDLSSPRLQTVGWKELVASVERCGLNVGELEVSPGHFQCPVRLYVVNGAADAVPAVIGALGVEAGEATVLNRSAPYLFGLVLGDERYDGVALYHLVGLPKTVTATITQSIRLGEAAYLDGGLEPQADEGPFIYEGWYVILTGIQTDAGLVRLSYFTRTEPVPNTSEVHGVAVMRCEFRDGELSTDARVRAIDSVTKAVVRAVGGRGDFDLEPPLEPGFTSDFAKPQSYLGENGIRVEVDRVRIERPGKGT